MALEPGDTLGPYVVIAPVGAGAMGEVYKARDTRLGRTVALKVIANGLGNQSELRRSFAAEARAIAALNHPHICTLYDTGQHEGTEFLVLEYLEGESLAQRLRRGPLPVKELLRTATEIAEALAYAHRRDIIHRDLKPANVHSWPAPAGQSCSILASPRCARRHRAAIRRPGLPPHRWARPGTNVSWARSSLSPERFDGRPAGATSDIFAFGAMLYEMATGRKAFEGQGEARLIASILSSEPAPIDPELGLPPAFQWLVQTVPDQGPGCPLAIEWRCREGSSEHHSNRAGGGDSPGSTNAGRLACRGRRNDCCRPRGGRALLVAVHFREDR